MCHQSVGLIARQLEAAGIATVSLSCAWSITRRVNPPRALYLDWPLGRTAGLPHRPDVQRAVLRGALSLIATAGAPGTAVTLDIPWPGGDAWKATAMRPTAGGSAEGGGGGDSRTARSGDPQWQHPEDAEAFAAAASSAP